MEFGEDDDELWMLTPAMKAKIKNSEPKEKPLEEKVAAPPKSDFAKLSSLSRKLQKHIEKQERKKRLGGPSARLSVTSLPSVDEVSGEEDTPNRTPRKFSAASLPSEDMETARGVSPHKDSDEDTHSSNVDRLCGAMTHINLHTKHPGAEDTFEHYERMVNAGTYVAPEEANHVPFEDLEFIAEEECVNEEALRGTVAEAPSFLNTGYHPDNVRWDLPNPLMHSLDETVESRRVVELNYAVEGSRLGHEQAFVQSSHGEQKIHEGSPEDEFFDASDSPLDAAFVEGESLAEIPDSGTATGAFGEQNAKLMNVNTLERVVEETSYDRRALLDGGPWGFSASLGPMTIAPRASSVSPRTRLAQEESKEKASSMKPTKRVVLDTTPRDINNDPMTQSAHPSLGARRQGENRQVMTARLASEPPTNFHTSNPSLTPRSTGAQWTPRSAQQHVQADINQLQEKARMQEEALRREAMLGERKHSWHQDDKHRRPRNAAPTAQQISSSKSADMLAIQPRAQSVSRLPQPKAGLRSGLLAPGFRTNKLSCTPTRAVPARGRAPGVQRGRPEAKATLDDCF